MYILMYAESEEVKNLSYNLGRSKNKRTRQIKFVFDTIHVNMKTYLK